MKKHIITLLGKKNKGSTGIEALMVFGVSLVLFLAIMLITLSAFSNINNKWMIKQCAREYLLIAETQGCLTDHDIGQMILELNSYGFENVNTDGTTVTHQPYGDPVYVIFSGTYKSHKTNSSLFKFFESGEEPLTVIRQSTSKY